MAITPNEDQAKAIKHASDWFRSPSKTKETFFILSGVAGSGKSTMIPFIVDAMGLTPHDVRYIAFTGKAANVLRQKGMDASTIHSLIYRPYTDKKGKLVFAKQWELPSYIKLLICDEASTVSAQLRRDLESFRIPVLYIGDHAQLPPVSKDMINLMSNPHVRLEKIMRQAMDNPIIRISDMARRGIPIPYGDHGTVLKIRRKQLTLTMVSETNQMLCAFNTTRHTINSKIRKTLNFDSKYPVPEDRLICLKNNNEIGLINGMIGSCVSFSEADMRLNFVSEDDEVFNGIICDERVFTIGEPSPYKKEIECFDFGYCITVYKSQGSQFDHVILFDEKFGYDADIRRRHTYTGITRAVEKLIIVD